MWNGTVPFIRYYTKVFVCPIVWLQPSPSSSHSHKGLYSIKVVIIAAKNLDCDIPTITMPVQTTLIISKCSRIIKFSNKIERKEQTGHVCRWMAFGITIVTVVVECTSVIGLFEWRDRSRMESRNADTHLWRKNVYDLNMRVAKLSLLGETMEKHW